MTAGESVTFPGEPDQVRFRWEVLEPTDYMPADELELTYTRPGAWFSGGWRLTAFEVRKGRPHCHVRTWNQSDTQLPPRFVTDLAAKHAPWGTS